MNTNAGNKEIHWSGRMPGFNAKMWKDDTGVATVISFAYDNSVDDRFHVRSWEDDDDDVYITFDHDEESDGVRLHPPQTAQKVTFFPRRNYT